MCLLDARLDGGQIQKTKYILFILSFLVYVWNKI